MKWLFKWIFRLIFLVIVLIVALIWSKDAILKAALERHIYARTGMEAKIGKFSAGLLSPVVDIQNFKLYNPPEFGGTLFLDAPEVHIQYDRIALAYREARVKLLRMTIAELNIVKSDTGKTNFAAVGWKTPTRDTALRPKTQFPAVEVLNLSVIHARYVDLKHPEKNRDFRPNFQNQIFKGVKSEDDIRDILFFIWLRGGGGVPIQGVTIKSSP